MIDSRSSFGYQKIIIAVLLVDHRAFGYSNGSTLGDRSDRSDELALLGAELLHHDAGEAVLVFAEIPLHIEQPFASVRIMEQKMIEPAGVQINRIGPRALNGRRRHHIVVKILVDSPAAHDIGEA
ncbi:hypothetical protein D3C71_1369370 [compost metagenome]